MKSTIRNLSGSAVVLPPTFDSLSLGAGQSVDKTYSTLPAADLAQLKALAKAGTISFPGNTGSGILAGLQVTPALTYVLNGQEPAGQPDGAEVFSIDDDQRRRLKKGKWSTIDQDDWTAIADCDRGFWLGNVCQQLKDGRVMLIGGFDENFEQGGDRNRFYDPSTDTWDEAPALDKDGCVGLGWCLLKNGKLLVAGGEVEYGFDNPGDNAKSRLFDPKTDTWSPTAGDMPEANVVGNTPFNPMVRLDDGNVLFVGGFDSSFQFQTYQDCTRKCYLYNTAAGTWSTTGLMATAHEGGVYYPLPDNKAIVIGGHLKHAPGLWTTMSFSNTYEIYSAGTFSGAAPLPLVDGEDVGRADNITVAVGARGGRQLCGSATTKDKIVLFGGRFGAVVDADTDTQLLYRSSILIYDIATNHWDISGVGMPFTCTDLYCAALDKDNILVVGGENYDIGYLPSAKSFIYNIPNDTLTPSADYPTIFRSWELYPEAGPVGLLPYEFSDENTNNFVAMKDGSFIIFAGLSTDTYLGDNLSLHGSSLTIDKKRGRSRTPRVYSGNEKAGAKTKHTAMMKRVHGRGY